MSSLHNHAVLSGGKPLWILGSLTISDTLSQLMSYTMLTHKTVNRIGCYTFIHTKTMEAGKYQHVDSNKSLVYN